jgi:hypothetical protein
VERSSGLGAKDFGEITLGMRARTFRALCGLAGLLALSNCATTQESIQDCRKAAYSFCEKAGAKDAALRGPEVVDGATRNRAHQECLDTQLGACGIP